MKKRTDQASVELFHLLCLAQIAQKVDAKKVVLKGGCNLRFFFSSSRYSEDMDLDVEQEPVDVLREKMNSIFKSKPFRQILQAHGLQLEHVTESKQTETTQRWKIGLQTDPKKHPLPTKIEFSRRGLDEPPVFECIDPVILRAYRLPPLLFSHYTAPAAFRQKLKALVSRKVPQARDIFDLHLLLASGRVKTSNDLLPRDFSREAVADRLMSVGFDTFKAQALAYLPSDQQAFYDAPERWDSLVLSVLEALTGGAT